MRHVGGWIVVVCVKEISDVANGVAWRSDRREIHIGVRSNMHVSVRCRSQSGSDH